MGRLRPWPTARPITWRPSSWTAPRYQEDAFKTAYQTIIGVTISGLVDDELVDESQTPVLTVTYTFNNGTEPITVEYLPYDINNYCVRREGSVDLICKKDQVDSILPTMADLAAGNLDEEEE